MIGVTEGGQTIGLSCKGLPQLCGVRWGSFLVMWDRGKYLTSPSFKGFFKYFRESLSIGIVYVNYRNGFIVTRSQFSGDHTLKGIGRAGSKKEVFTCVRR